MTEVQYTRYVTLFKVSMTHESQYELLACTGAMKILVVFIVGYEITVKYSFSPSQIICLKQISVNSGVRTQDQF
jgi:hypothetical protein